MSALEIILPKTTVEFLLASSYRYNFIQFWQTNTTQNTPYFFTFQNYYLVPTSCMHCFYLSHESLMSLVVLQLFPTLAPHKAGCMSPLTNKEHVIRGEGLKIGGEIKKY